MTTEPEEAFVVPPIELPDDRIREILGILQPLLVSAIQELDQSGYPGWATFLGIQYDLMNSVLGGE